MNSKQVYRDIKATARYFSWVAKIADEGDYSAWCSANHAAKALCALENARADSNQFAMVVKAYDASIYGAASEFVM